MDRNNLKNLSRSLSEVHRSLLNFQKEIHQGLDERRLSAYDVLHASIHHPDYEWLKPMTALIAKIDEVVDDPEITASDLGNDAAAELGRINSRLEIATSKDPLFFIQIADLKNAISKNLV